VNTLRRNGSPPPPPWSEGVGTHLMPPGRCRRNASASWPCSRSAKGLCGLAGGRRWPASGEARVPTGPWSWPRRAAARCSSQVAWSWFAIGAGTDRSRPAFWLGFCQNAAATVRARGQSALSRRGTVDAPGLGGLPPPPLHPTPPAATCTGLQGLGQKLPPSTWPPAGRMKQGARPGMPPRNRS